MAIRKAKGSSKRRPSQAEEAVEAEHMFEADHDEGSFQKRLNRIAKEKRPGRKRKAKR